MVATIATPSKGKNKASQVETPVAPVEQTAPETIAPTPETPATNGEAHTTNGKPGIEPGKTYTVKEYRAACGFNMSAYLRELLTANPEITTEDVIVLLTEAHPQLTYKKDGLGQVLSNTKTALKGGNGKTAQPNNNVTMEDIVKAKSVVKENGGIDVLLSALENYRKFKVLADAFGGEEKAVKVLELMDALRKE